LELLSGRTHYSLGGYLARGRNPVLQGLGYYNPSPYVYHIFDKVNYVPVEKTEFQTVALEVLTKLGVRVPFPDIIKPLDAALDFRRRV
jgi:hypothetical protein